MKEPWYQCARQFKWTGYVSKVDNKFTSKALAHYDPVQAQDTTRQDVDIILCTFLIKVLSKLVG